MRHTNCIVASIGAMIGFCATAIAVPPPPLDRPTPPPCCADGYCYPNPTTFGWYERRWRRWPTETLEPTPAKVTPPERLGPDIRPFDLPPVEEEDRRAPPPTQPAERPEGEEGETAPGTPAPGTTPLPPPGRGTPPRSGLPFEDDAPGTGLPFGEPDTNTPAVPFGQPATEQPNGLPFGEPATEPPTVPFGQPPTGDLDPPPAPPFGAPASGSGRIAEGPVFRASERPAPAVPPAARARRVPANDPPPSLPLSLAQVAY